MSARTAGRRRLAQPLVALLLVGLSAGGASARDAWDAVARVVAVGDVHGLAKDDATLSMLVGPVAAGQDAPRAPTDAERDQKKLEELAEPWPDAEKLAERQAAAENLPLFRTAEPLEFTLEADFEGLDDDRTVDSPRRFPGTLTVAGDAGQPVVIPVQLASRGRLRLEQSVCDFVPLRVEFEKKQAKGTPFEKQDSLKLVTHCRNGSDYDQRVLEEALAYRIGNLLTPASFRVRVGRATYVDSGSGKKLVTKWAFFIEDADDVARRLQGRVAPLGKQPFHNLDEPSLLRLSVFQFAIGNPDFSITGLHNIRLVQDHLGVLRAVAYDFDVTGLVNAPYGMPDKRLGIKALRDRLYRGPCRTLVELEPILAEFRALETQILALYDDTSGLEQKQRGAAKSFLGDFFDIISSPKRSQRFFVDRCRHSAGL